MSDPAMMDLARRLAPHMHALLMPRFYTSGTWTLTYTGGTTAGTTTYTTQSGNYIRLANIVIAIGYVVWTAATGTGNARLSLPFTCAAGLPRVPVPLVVDGVTFANGAPEGLIIGGNNFLELYSPITNGATVAVGVEAAGQIAFTAVYSQ